MTRTAFSQHVRLLGRIFCRQVDGEILQFLEGELGGFTEALDNRLCHDAVLKKKFCLAEKLTCFQFRSV